jgi:hypothetical protein
VYLSAAGGMEEKGSSCAIDGSEKMNKREKKLKVCIFSKLLF